MNAQLPIRTALISVFHKTGLDPIVAALKKLGVTLYSTGGTAQYLESQGATVHEVADLTGYPSILGGRVKTLHPKVHGGILARREEKEDLEALSTYDIPPIDLVVVDLYPFEETVKQGASEAEVIEKIDIGGIALIRGAAKNFDHVTVIPSQVYYPTLLQILEKQGGETTYAQRKDLAAAAFGVSSHYDTHIHQYFVPESKEVLKLSLAQPTVLRYGENPHQEGYFFGDLDGQFEQLNGKALSYNNLVDIEGALQLVDEFSSPFFAVIKHTNPCGCSVGENMLDAWQKALAGDPVSAFGGILACNGTIDLATAAAMDALFFEVLVAEDYDADALDVLKSKKNRILLRRISQPQSTRQVKSALNGYLVQTYDRRLTPPEDWACQTPRKPTSTEAADILFGDTVCKHLKSNAIAIVKNQQLIGSGVGQTSRIDALKQAIAKALEKGFDLKGAVLASDAFFPFRDSVELAYQHGIEVVVEPGGSRKDNETIEYCVSNNMCLIFTGLRHFKH